MATNNVLLVDDEDVVRLTTSLMLKKLGVSVTAISNGAEALEYFKENYSEVDLVILDNHMPGISGLELYMELKNINPDVCGVISSGFLDSKELEQFEGIGMHGVLNKPFSIRDLKELLAELNS